MIEFKLPSLGADMDEGTLIEWQIKPGDAVKKGQIVAIVDTTKAAVDVECWQEGVVAELCVQPGEKMPVNTVMALLLEPGEQAPGEPRGRSVPATNAAEVGAGETGRPSGRRWPEEATALCAPTAGPPAFAAPASAPATQVTVKIAATRPAVSPAARKRAAELGVNIAAISATGPHNSVTLADVENAAPKVASPVGKGVEMRRAIAAAMARSKREIPHYYLCEAIPMARALNWLAAENARRTMTERLLPAALLLKAVARALKRFPELNGTFENGTFTTSAAVHLGVAISLRQGGLIAPALLDADSLPLTQLMQGLTDLVKRTRAGSLKSSEMSKPTITVTNLGDQGCDIVQGVIYPPQVALVGFGRISERPWVVEGQVQSTPLVSASLAADHRVSDGHRGALFLVELRDLLQQPEEFAS